jgi:hypothetical protein
MKTAKLLIFLFIAVAFFPSCEYLDVEPEKKGTLEEAFATVNSARNFLYTCYSFMPQSHDHNGEPQQNGAGDEVCLSGQWATSWHYSKIINLGSQTASDPIYNYWSYYTSSTQPSRSRAYNLYGGIRQCYVFLNRIKTVPGIDADEAKLLSAQAKFLIAYYHYLLLRLYGPIVIVEGEINLNATGELAFPKRKPYDECVQWIANRIDEVVPDLPLRFDSDKYGAPTRVAALAVKSRMLLYAASPLFNGNSEYYSEFKNKDGKLLMNLEYDKEKWKKALDATEEAINEAHVAGHALYTMTNYPNGATDFRKAYLNHRWSSVTMPSEGNNDIIWAYTAYVTNFQAMLTARGVSEGSNNVPYGGISPSMFMVEKYLTKNGLPIDKDPAFDYDNRYAVTTIPGTNDKTAYMHLNREPRFYGDIAYDRAQNYELDGRDNYTLYMRMGETNPVTKITNGNDPLRDGFSPNGYYLKKFVHPNSAFRNNAQNLKNVAMPLVRLTELYLNYAEAYYEYYGVLDGKALEYLNEIRANAGIPDVETAWTGIAGKDYREIIRLERTIELMYEGHRFFDARRWKTAHLTFTKEQKRWNCFPSGFSIFKPQPAEDYLTLRSTNEPTKTFVVPQHYLYPIDAKDIDINLNLVQNPGW